MNTAERKKKINITILKIPHRKNEISDIASALTMRSLASLGMTELAQARHPEQSLPSPAKSVIPSEVCHPQRSLSSRAERGISSM